MKIAIAGSSGFIGSHLVSFLQNKNHELILLSRTSNKGRHYWNPEEKQIDGSLLEGVEVVINLCGETILGRWTQKKMERIRKSRLLPTQFLCQTILNLPTFPKLYIGASAVGYYGDRGENMLTETDSAGEDYLSHVCRQWEGASHSLVSEGIRVVLPRFGVVLAKGGGALKRMEKPFRMGVGGVLGSGNQMMSWIAMDDLLHAIVHLIDHQELSGPINFVAPKAVSNREFTKTLGRVLHRPTYFAIPESFLFFFFRSGSQMLLSSTYAYPERLLKSGYRFMYPEIEPALKKIFADKSLS